MTACFDDNTAIAFAAGELDDDDAAAIERHVDVCTECLALVAAIARTTSLMPDGDGDRSATAFAPVGGLRRETKIGRYELLALVGIGGMGAVYAARDPELRRVVALKLVRAERGSDAAAQTKRLLDEARTMARLAHPNVVSIHDVGTYDGRVFLAMDLVEGQTLSEWQRSGRRAASEILATFVQAGRGLAAAHAAGIVHRDFKPDNVLVGNDGRVVVTDFGLAHTHEPNEARGKATDVLVGTLAYMAPEQLRGELADPRADQFAFAVSLHEALAGERPFAGRTRDELLGAMTTSERRRPLSLPRLPSSSSTRVPARVRSALRRALAPAASDRFPSMDALLGELARVATPRWRAAALAAGAAALIGGGATVGMALHHEPRLSCRTAIAEKVSGIWDAPRRAAVHEAFLATKRPFAEDAWARVDRAIDAYLSTWQAVHGDACEATHARHEQSAELLDLRVACLGERLAEVRALTDLFVHATPEIVQHASAAAAELVPLDRCADALALRAVAPPARAQAAEVRRLQRDLAQVKALTDAGRVGEGRALAVTTALAARTLGYAPLEGAALFRLGDAEMAAGDATKAAATLERALEASDAAKDDVTRATVLGQRLFVEGYTLGRGDRVDELDGQAQAAIRRIGGSPELEAGRLHALGMANLARGDLNAAGDALGGAAVLRGKVFGAKSRAVAMSVNGLCLVENARGNLDAALVQCERASQIWSEVLGPTHPDVALGDNNVGGLLELLGRHDEACERFDRALRVADAALGPDHPQIAMTLGNLGACLVAQGHAASAIDLDLRALGMRERLFGTSSLRVAATLTNLGEAYAVAGDAERAVDALERADHLFDQPGSDASQKGEQRFALARALVLERPRLGSGSTPRGPADARRDKQRARSLALEARALLVKPSEEHARQEIDAWLLRER